MRPSTNEYTELPIRNWVEWDVTGVKNALSRLEYGSFTDAALLCDYMLRDDRVASVLDSRLLGLLGLPLEIAGADDRLRSKKIAETLEADFWRILPRSSLRDLLRWTRMIGVGVGELVWEKGERWTPHLKVWHPMYLSWRWDTRSYQLMTSAGPLDLTPGDGHWVMLKADERYPFYSGLVRRLAIPWLIRQWAYRDWARYSEVHGMPIRVGKVPSGAEDEDKKKFLSQLANLGSETVLLAPQGDSPQTSFGLELIEAQADTWEGFEKLIERASDSIAIAVLGQNLTTEVQGGSFAAAQVHEQVKQDYLEADAALVSEGLREQVVRPWVGYNYADAAPPLIAFDTDPPSDQELEAQTAASNAQAFATLAQAAQQVETPIDFATLAQQFGIPLLDTETRLALGMLGKDDPAYERLADLAFATMVRREQVRLASGDDPKTAPGFVNGQLYADALAEYSQAHSAFILRPDLDAALRLISEAEDYQSLRSSLAKLYEGMSPEKLSELTEKALVLGELAGHLAVKEDDSS